MHARTREVALALCVLCSALASGGGCSGSSSGGGGSSSDAAPARDGAAGTARWAPAPGTSWQWQLSGALDTTFDVQAYDIDLFNTTAEQISALHAQGRKVICYFDTAYEPGRRDSAALEPYQGNPVIGWPGEFWLDVREPVVVATMKARIALAATHACDGIEADDVNAITNDPGFDDDPLTAADQLAFIRALAAEAHARGLAYGLKNDLDQVANLLPDADFAINEECFSFSECDGLSPFIGAGKAVFQVEYADGGDSALANKGSVICPEANALDFDTLIKHLDLGPPRYPCR